MRVRVVVRDDKRTPPPPPLCCLSLAGSIGRGRPRTWTESQVMLGSWYKT